VVSDWVLVMTIMLWLVVWFALSLGFGFSIAPSLKNLTGEVHPDQSGI